MFNIESPDLRPSCLDFHQRALRARRLVISTCVRGMVHSFVQWLRVISRSGTRLLRKLTAEWRLRRNVRALQRLDDRTLSDIGLARGEIETIVRTGRPGQPTRIQQLWSSIPAQRDAA